MEVSSWWGPAVSAKGDVVCVWVSKNNISSDLPSVLDDLHYCSRLRDRMWRMAKTTCMWRSSCVNVFIRLLPTAHQHNELHIGNIPTRPPPMSLSIDETSNLSIDRTSNLSIDGTSKQMSSRQSSALQDPISCTGTLFPSKRTRTLCCKKLRNVHILSMALPLYILQHMILPNTLHKSGRKFSRRLT